MKYVLNFDHYDKVRVDLYIRWGKEKGIDLTKPLELAPAKFGNMNIVGTRFNVSSDMMIPWNLDSKTLEDYL